MSFNYACFLLPPRTNPAANPTAAAIPPQIAAALPFPSFGNNFLIFSKAAFIFSSPTRAVIFSFFLVLAASTASSNSFTIFLTLSSADSLTNFSFAERTLFSAVFTALASSDSFKASLAVLRASSGASAVFANFSPSFLSLFNSSKSFLS